MTRIRLAALTALAAFVSLPILAAVPEPLSWPEDQQSFWFEGPSWLLPEDERARLAALPSEERGRSMAAFLERDPDPSTADNELLLGIDRRHRLVEDDLFTFVDERSRLLFLHGEPAERMLVDCEEAYLPLEIWTYGQHRLVLYQPRPDAPYRLWTPAEGKRILYTRELMYWLEEWEMFKKFISGGKRFDRQLCPEAKLVDEVTGVDGLFEFENPPSDLVLLAFLAAPDDLSAWAAEAADTPLPEPPPALLIDSYETTFPRRQGLRLDSRELVVLAADSPIVPWVDEDQQQIRLTIEGIVETEDDIFDRFRVRFELEPPEEGTPLALAFEHPLRTRSSFRVRIRIRDEVGGAEIVTSHVIAVPGQPDYSGRNPEEVNTPTARLGEQLSTSADGLILLVPPREVVFGGLRVQAVAKGPRITQVRFVVDGKPQITKKRSPFSAELALPHLPRELVIRAEGLDAEGTVVKADEVVLNQPRGQLGVEILSPLRGERVNGRFTAAAQVVVPEGRRVERLEFHLNDRPVTELEKPPWEAELEMPVTADGLVFMTVVAELDDGSRAEDVRFLSSPYDMGVVDVRLVELYTTVIGRQGIVRDLGQEVFEVFEDDREQEIARFELVENLPLTIGITLDVSGSMFASLGTAQRAAVSFLENIVSPRDECFAVAFASEPALIMHRTPDVGAVEVALEDVDAGGWTSLHDAVVFSLYYFRGVTGRRAVVLLSDGDDTDSRLEFDQALEYAMGSGVVVYTIGLKNDALDGTAKRKLRRLAEETGGRAFLIDEAEELTDVYDEIEEELRSQYLLAYASDRPQRDGQFRTVKVEVKKSGLEARTIQGYFP